MATNSEREPLLSPAASQNSTAKPDSVAPSEQIPQLSYPLLKFAIAWLGVLLANLDIGLILATHSSIASDLGDLEHEAWLLTGYQLGYSVALPTGGALSNIFGRKVPLLLSYALFGLGSLICGVGPSLLTVAAGRIIQGLGGAGVTSLVAIVIRDYASVSRAAVLLSYLNIAAIVGRAAGGPIGGLLYDSIGWRWSFIGQVPIALVCFCGGAIQSLPTIPQNEREHDTEPKKRSRLDFLGLLTMTIAIISFLIVTDSASQGVHMANPMLWAPLIIFAASIISLVFIETRVSSNPIFVPELFKQRGVALHYVLQMLLFAAQFCALSIIPTYFIRTGNVSNTIASLVLLPAPFGNAMGAFAAGKFIERSKQYLPPLYLLCIISPVAYTILLLRWSPLPLPWGQSRNTSSGISAHGNATTAHLPLSPWECLVMGPTAFACGMGAVACFAGISASVSHEQSAVAISVYYLSQNMGVIIGAAGGVGSARIGFTHFLTRDLRREENNEEIIRKTLTDSRWIWHHASSWVQRIAVHSYAMGFMFVSIFCLTCVCLAVPVITLMPRRKVQ